MIDLHMHSIYSDGSKTVEEILKKCEEKKLEYISITDHNTAKQYEDKSLKNNNIFKGKVIKGVELNAVFQDKNIEVLGYNINPDIINKWCQKYYSEEELEKQQEICYKRLIDICNKQGLIYDESKIVKPKVTGYVEISIYNELMKHKENYEILGEFTKSLGIFFRKGLANPRSIYFVNRIEFRPKYKEVIDIIHKAGGKAFLAHPFEYKFEDTISFINDLRKEKELDGIECFHPSASIERRNSLVNYAKNNELYISGGSDYHGNSKPDIDIGIGRGDLNISKKILKWL